MGKATGGEDWMGNHLRGTCRASEPVAMRDKKRGKLKASREGLSLANVLRESLLCGIVVVDSRQRVSLLAGETEEILGLRQHRAGGYSIHDLPDSLQKLASQVIAS